jgi:hypothetical protein
VNVFDDVVRFLDDREDGETAAKKRKRFAVFRDRYTDRKRDHDTGEMVEFACFRPEVNVEPTALFAFSTAGANGGVHEARIRAIQRAGTTIGPLGEAALTAYSPSYEEMSRTAQWRKAPPAKRMKSTSA